MNIDDQFTIPLSHDINDAIASPSASTNSNKKSMPEAVSISFIQQHIYCQVMLLRLIQKLKHFISYSLQKEKII